MKLFPLARILLALSYILVLMFMLGPVLVIVLLSFNSAQYGSFPIENFSLHWFKELTKDQSIITAVKTSLLIGVTSSFIATLIGTSAAYAVSRFRFWGRGIIQMLLTLPILVPHVILGVGLLVSFRFFGLNKSLLLLIVGHVALILPFVVLTTQHRLQLIPIYLEEAARTLGAGRLHTFRTVTLPLTMPAIVAGWILAFMSSFDEVTATLFWRPANTETIPTYVMGMLQFSVDQRLNALGAVLVGLTTFIPLAVAMIRLFSRQSSISLPSLRETSSTNLSRRVLCISSPKLTPLDEATVPIRS
ncbi:ABC transporter permease [Agrobacterium sp. ICMP 6402]|uniref:ABC transporter permease n=1 Tax=Agrobacterium sp. ICMP 6402 TaxID=2292443 RepID=UPI0012977F1E|nr:ABC transporter permease [Agrobacterium sp. ICMP 6402]MQB12367.1 ABC transporter permease [Agrobacterium sp. ICMP 6402]